MNIKYLRYKPMVCIFFLLVLLQPLYSQTSITIPSFKNSTMANVMPVYIAKGDNSDYLNLNLCQCGHTKAICLSKKKKKIKLLDTTETIIRIREDADLLFKDSPISFKPGDKILLYTDCLVERTRIDGEIFGEIRLINTLKNIFISI